MKKSKQPKSGAHRQVRRQACTVLAACVLAFGNASAARAQARDGAAPTPAVQASEVGHAARAWLALQRSNAAAAPAQPMLGAEAGLAYQRYMESFRTKIPASFGSSMGSQGGNALRLDYGNGGAAQN